MTPQTLQPKPLCQSNSLLLKEVEKKDEFKQERKIYVFGAYNRVDTWEPADVTVTATNSAGWEAPSRKLMLVWQCSSAYRTMDRALYRTYVRYVYSKTNLLRHGAVPQSAAAAQSSAHPFRRLTYSQPDRLPLVRPGRRLWV